MARATRARAVLAHNPTTAELIHMDKLKLHEKITVTDKYGRKS